MTEDATRLEALKKGANGAGNTGYVTIRTVDLRWLLELVDSQRAAQRIPSKPADATGGK